MTPKEKARELVEKYDSILTYIESRSKAKQCAIIAVDEILNALSPYGSKYKYWLEVKQEIEKL